MPGLPRKSDIAAEQHRKRWRDGVLAEVDRSAKTIQEQLEDKAAALQQTEEALRQKIIELQEWEQMLINAQQKFGEVQQNIQAYYEELLQQKHQEMLSEIQLRENSIALLQNKIMRIANRPDPKQGFAAWVAALLLQALEQHEIYCRLVSYQKIPASREVSVWVDLEPGQQSRKLEAIAKEERKHTMHYIKMHRERSQAGKFQEYTYLDCVTRIMARQGRTQHTAHEIG